MLDKSQVKYLQKSRKINLRDELGMYSFPDETPLVTQLFRKLEGVVYITSPVPVPNVAAPHIIYLDLSKWNWPINLEIAYERGVRVVWIKCNQGLWPDSEFENLVAAAEAAGMEIGFYHFLDPGQAGVTAENAAQLAYDMTRGIGRFSMWLDVERAGILRPDQLLDHLMAWCDHYGGLSGRKIEVYTRLSFFNSAVARSSYWRNRNIDLVGARYNLALSSPWSDGRYVPLDWLYAGPNFNKWQYSDNNGLGSYFGSQGALSIDLNIFPGIFEDLLLDQGVMVDPIPPPVQVSDRFRTLFAGQNFRTEPTTQARDATVIKKLSEGTIITAAECPTVGQAYSGMRVYIPGPAGSKEIWIHGADETDQIGWLAAYHPTRSGVFVESIEPG